ncbi:FAD/NAD-P-binding domain-containing protein [Armillaria novae-zelandiae]|uniref:FAD/NAD-P-binding domain-containing protein n=1 Tax=Armillaria novae-zelandiae TaxID=153914 RepID=A0AA39UIY0_9AGAR|nr:FAD/NAD-P-binding domain-containing protein [Armillaria novae-zelandiae]
MLSVTRKQVHRPSQIFVRTFLSPPTRGKQSLVILGSGWGGYEVLRGVDKRNWNVTIISPNTYFNFTPLLASAAVGTLEFRCTVEPVRRYTPRVSYYQAWCDNIDFKHKTLTCVAATPPVSFGSAPPASPQPFSIKYDKLVIAVGAYRQTFGIPGVKEHAHFLKDVKDARRIRTRILECLEQANQPDMTDAERRKLLNFCVVGGGPTGVEFAAELHDLLHTEIAQQHPELAKMARINLYDVADSILGTFDRSLVSSALGTLKIHYDATASIFISGTTLRKLRRHVPSFADSPAILTISKGKLFIKEVGEVPFGLLVWSTGLAPNPLIEAITELKKRDTTNRVLTDGYLNALNVDGTPNLDVWAIGDAASIESDPLPATAQVANQKAKYVTKTLNKLPTLTHSHEDEEVSKDAHVDEPFQFRNRGSLAYIGGWRAIYDRSKATGDGEPKFMNKESGRVAWLLWRSAYFTQTLSWRNKILVPTYWFLNWIFGRDLTRF